VSVIHPSESGMHINSVNIYLFLSFL